MPKRILITGHGLLGSNLRRIALEEGYQVIVAEVDEKRLPSDCEAICLDIAKRDDVFNLLKDKSLDAIIHTAALTPIERCEREVESAYSVNVRGTLNIADFCKEEGIRMIYTSTDYVFDGKKGDYREESEPFPINTHGWTKYVGEVVVKNRLSDYAIVRFGYLYAFDRKHPTFIQWLDCKSREEEVVDLPDTIYSPTDVVSCSRALLQLVDNQELNGIFHIAGSNSITLYDFGVKLCRLLGFREALRKVDSDEYWKGQIHVGDKSLIPRNTALNVEKAQNVGLTISSLDEV